MHNIGGGMKKIFALLIATALVIGFASCGGETVTQIGESADKTNKVGPAFSDVTVESQEKPVEPPKDERPPSELAKTIVFETSKGTYEITLYGDTTTESANMIDKVNAKAFDGLTFHRIVKKFVIQGGDPLGNGTGGGDMPMSGVRTHKNVRGTIAMASSSQKQPIDFQSDMQFFINTNDNFNLDSMGFTAFGEVTKGMDVIDAIENTPTRVDPKDPRQENSQPAEQVKIIRAYVK